jgi:hypothetical protein
MTIAFFFQPNDPFQLNDLSPLNATFKPSTFYFPNFLLSTFKLLSPPAVGQAAPPADSTFNSHARFPFLATMFSSSRPIHSLLVYRYPLALIFSRLHTSMQLRNYVFSRLYAFKIVLTQKSGFVIKVRQYLMITNAKFH